MNEVRSILKHSNSHSLVIGDEVASGTETVSGIAIVASTILTLVERNTCFLFATHLHEVAEMDAIRSNTKVGLYHMSVHYDEKQDVLYYDRVLKKGTGSTMYGLEVCKSLEMPESFLHLANTIRQEYLEMSPQLVSMKTSRYSPTIKVDVCSICKKPAQEVHHLKEQHTADKYGYIGVIHKNDLHNLTALCESCHDNIHQEKIKTEGYKMTSHGVQLMVTLPDEEKVNHDHKKYYPLIIKTQLKS
jgi:DNA mismatch repair protein MutS